MATTTFADLPDDLLIMIITQLKTISDTTEDLASCLTVNRRWREATTPLLYGNVALKQHNLSRFCEQLNAESFATRIRSITVTLQPGGAIEPVGHLARLLPHFTNLRSFSFWLREQHGTAIPQSILIQLVEFLPQSCTNLELDTLGYDVRASNSTTHLCISLRTILPRLEHVRLRLQTCAALFSDGVRSIHLPRLKTLIMSCARSTPLPTCHSTSPPNHPTPLPLWPSVTSSLTSLLATPHAVPPDARVLAFTSTDRNDTDRSLWTAHVLADMRARKSVAMPYRLVCLESSVPGSHVIRLPNGAEMMSTNAGLEAVAEGQLWREVRGGARLPAAAVLGDAGAGRGGSFAQGCVEAGIPYLKTSGEWRVENPRKSMSTWRLEERLDMRLVGAEVRAGEGRFLGLDMVREITPEGWRRVGVGDELERVEE